MWHAAAVAEIRLFSHAPTGVTVQYSTVQYDCSSGECGTLCGTLPLCCSMAAACWVCRGKLMEPVVYLIEPYDTAAVVMYDALRGRCRLQLCRHILRAPLTLCSDPPTGRLQPLLLHFAATAASDMHTICVPACLRACLLAWCCFVVTAAAPRLQHTWNDMSTGVKWSACCHNNSLPPRVTA